MSKYIPGNQKHLTLEDRIYIENELNKGTSFKDIARFLCKDPTTISKEVRAHRLSDWYHKGTFYNAKNFCLHRYHCRKTNACGKIVLCGIKCTSCPTCNQTCKDFVKERCLRLDRAPYVCNGCDKKITHCTIAHKYNYNARFADRKYREKLRDSRAGINMTKRELHQKDKIISPLIEQGQSPYHILTNHPELAMYYCDPMQSGQKGGLEQAHTMLRMILPKGTSFEFLTQWDVNLIVNHINSTPRECLGGRTPYSMALETLGKEALNAFQLRPIAPDEVNLTPKLIRFNH